MKKMIILAGLIFCAININAQPTIHHYSIGEGEPILLINGGPGWSSHHMKPVAEKLSGMGYEVILFDQRGTGKSKVEIDSTTIEFDLMVDDIEKIRKQKKIDSWIVYGHSFGGMLAMAYASKYPQRIKKLILSAPGGVDLSFLNYYQTNLNYPLSEQEKRAIRKWSDPEQIQENPKLASYKIIKNTISSYVFNDTLTDTIMSEIDKNTWNIQTGNLVFQDLINTNYNLKPELHKITAPTLIIQGRQDALGQQNPIIVSQLVPNSRLVFLEQSAHLMWLDRPDAYYQTIEDFLGKPTPYTLINAEKARKILSDMKGEKRMKSRIKGKEGFITIEGQASFKEKLGGIEETAMISLNGKEVTARAYIKYSPRYKRFELVQIDNAANSFILLHGYWDAQSSTLKFKPVKNYSQWGSTGTLSLKWDYEFYEDGSFKKVMRIPNEKGKWIVQSDYHYIPKK